MRFKGKGGGESETGLTFFSKKKKKISLDVSFYVLDRVLFWARMGFLDLS
jgi:hypothetical protein